MAAQAQAPIDPMAAPPQPTGRSKVKGENIDQNVQAQKRATEGNINSQKREGRTPLIVQITPENEHLVSRANKGLIINLDGTLLRTPQYETWCNQNQSQNQNQNQNQYQKQPQNRGRGRGGGAYPNQYPGRGSGRGSGSWYNKGKGRPPQAEWERGCNEWDDEQSGASNSQKREYMEEDCYWSEPSGPFIRTQDGREYPISGPFIRTQDGREYLIYYGREYPISGPFIRTQDGREYPIYYPTNYNNRRRDKEDRKRDRRLSQKRQDRRRDHSTIEDSDRSSSQKRQDRRRDHKKSSTRDGREYPIYYSTNYDDRRRYKEDRKRDRSSSQKRLNRRNEPSSLEDSESDQSERIHKDRKIMSKSKKSSNDREDRRDASYGD